MLDDASRPDDLERGWIADQAKAATQWLQSLRTEQQRAASFALDSPERTEWSYLPGSRPGLSLVEMTAAQQDLAMALISTGCGPTEAPHARGAIELERVRRRLATGSDDLDGDRFWFRVFGNPATDDVWAWHVNGHHLAVHVTVTGAGVATTPSFLGAEPARVPSGPHAGWRFLAAEEDLGRGLLKTLDTEQTKQALVSEVAPADILTRHDPVVDTALIPSGISHDDLDPAQQERLHGLVRRYFERVPSDHAELCWNRVVDEGLGRLRFTWAGSDQPGQGHYYCVSGPSLLIEYDNTQDEANHIHSVWRDLANDWGFDLLARHYATAADDHGHNPR